MSDNDGEGSGDKRWVNWVEDLDSSVLHVSANHLDQMFSIDHFIVAIKQFFYEMEL